MALATPIGKEIGLATNSIAAVFQRKLAPLDQAVSVIVLFVFAIAQPLLDLLGGNAEFFLARASPPADIVLVGVLIAVVAPLATAGLVLLSAWIHPPTGTAIHVIVLALLGGILTLRIVELTPLRSAPDAVGMAIGAGVGLLISYLVYRAQIVRTMFRFGLVAPVASLALFLFFSPASQLIYRSEGTTEASAVTVANPAPVVFVIFDEFPVASLIDDNGYIEAEVYPNFARLAAEGTWYRNAITVEQQTEESVPVILTGNEAFPDRLPFAFDYPANLFTLLADQYELRVREQVTEMCPEYACENRSRPQLPASERWSTLASDLWIVSGHLFLPSGMRGGLPAIDHSWADFGTGISEEYEEFNIVRRFNQTTKDDRRIPFQEFLETMEAPTDEPTLDFIHVMIPHFPWQFVDTGQKFWAGHPMAGSNTTGWGSDEWLVNQAYQRHLIQVGYADALLGQLIEHMEEIGIYDDAVLVVVADHGIAIKTNIVHRRTALENTIGDVAAVPLFIKTPSQASGGPDDYRAETIDILPTVADALGIEVPWPTAGSSLIGVERPARTESTINGREGPVTFDVEGEEKLEISRAKIEAFGRTGPYGLAPPGQHDLLGLAIDGASVAEADGLSVSIQNPGRFSSVDTAADSLPLYFNGTVRGLDSGDERILAVAMNGEVVAVTRTYESEEGDTAFYAMLPHTRLRDGSNELVVYLVSGTGDDRRLARIRSV